MIPTNTNRPDHGGSRTVDMLSGFALDLPLGAQMPAAYWEMNPDLRDRLLDLRKRAGIVVESDELHKPEMAPEVTDAGTKQKRVAKPRARTTKGRMKRVAR